MTEKWGEIQGKWDLVRVSGVSSSYASSSYRGFTVFSEIFISSLLGLVNDDYGGLVLLLFILSTIL